ncbi:hypothetical protein COT78_02215 [Candidatus Berkelbacteria bacterium CG10_big_fil_rev_8_21_14_0_10_43_13]|uniref:Cell envelope-related transcriptional attenuator domain-containing protein n=1 Tax=Candidatus Berkelbacteria bacterium CG10_big_fil_rev_8_21_14_0_10_43_13 TaxID=1974514 RepID=A0A2H0W6G9_9BACT|nr:MAG: hypothetical protein COT78_02215 [Candidatus Berkelbacteria bacterium CG10_big_fil_rev_8_21_14_0_10_43_13]
MGFFKKTKKRTPLIESIKTKKKPFYRRRRWKIFFVALAVIIIIISGLAYYVLKSSSNIFENGISSMSLIRSLVGGKTETLKGENADRINILVTGMGGPSHKGGYLTDSIMLVSIQPKEKKMAMISVPRDLLAPIPDHKENKINSAFVSGRNEYYNQNCTKKRSSDCAKNAMSAGAALSVQTIEDITGQTIPYYINVEFDGFEKIIDALGGVDVYVDKAIYDTSFPAEDMLHYSTFSISAGMHHLDGATALKYARSRETTSDFDRAARQQKLLVAVKEKAASTNFLSNPATILNIFNSLTGSLYTNFSPTEIKSLVEIAKEVDKSNFISKVLSTASDSLLINANINGTYYLQPKSGDFKQIQKFVADIFNQKKAVAVEIASGAKLTSAEIASIAKDLKKDTSANFTVTTGSDYKNTLAQTAIYDYSDGSKADVMQNLKQKYNATVVKKTKTASITVDFYIVIGENYSAN